MQLIDRLLKRNWTPEYLARAVGECREAYFCHAADQEMQKAAASGGVVTAVLDRLLREKIADGALCVRSFVADGTVRAEFFIAKCAADLASAQGSKYMPVYFRDALPLIREFPGRLALVLLPCDARALSRIRRAEPGVDAKIAFVVTLFCGHNSERVLTDSVVKRFRAEHGQLRNFRHRFGHWRGRIGMEFEDGTSVVRPFSEFSDYQNLFFFSQRKCHACFDHTGFYGDLAAGDIWSQHMKKEPVKHTAVIARSKAASAILTCMFADRALSGYPVDMETVCDGQSRSLPFHYNVSARSRVSRIFGMRLKDLTKQEVKWNQLIVAFLVMLNEKVTRYEFGRWTVMRIPRPLLKMYLVMLKGLESL